MREHLEFDDPRAVVRELDRADAIEPEATKAGMRFEEDWPVARAPNARFRFNV